MGWKEGAIGALVGSWGCIGAPEDATQKAELTYYADIKPILDAKCVGCHQQGQIAPFLLTDYDEVFEVRELIWTAVEARIMPPWMPGPDCAEYVGDRSLSEEQIATIGRWVEQGAKAGDPDREGPPLPLEPVPGLERVDLTLGLPVP